MYEPVYIQNGYIFVLLEQSFSSETIIPLCVESKTSHRNEPVKCPSLEKSKEK